MVNKIFFVIVIFITSIFFGCSKSSQIITIRKGVTTSTLNLNGYYFVEESGENKGLKSIYFLYKNGVLLYAGSYKESDFKVIENIIIKNYINNKNQIAKRYQINWGVFTIDGTKVIIEKWEATEGIKKTSLRKGTILNNQSFQINEFYSPFTRKDYKVLETYNFREFSTKPDSTNSFIK